MKIKKTRNIKFIHSKLMEMDGIFVHHTAEVSRKAEIGKGTRIWNNAQIREGCVIGEDVIIGKDVYVDLDVRIGNRVKIQNGVSIYHGVVIEDDVFCGPHMTFTNDLYPRAFVGDFELYRTIIRKGASIGAHCTIVCGHVIGEYAMIGAGSVVSSDIPNYALCYGNPAVIRGWVSRFGRKLSFNDSGIAVCPKTGEVYLKNSSGTVVLVKQGKNDEADSPHHH